MSDDIKFDWQRTQRTGVPEVVYAQGKTLHQLQSIAQLVISRSQRVLMTRMAKDHAQVLTDQFASKVRFHEASSTLVVGTQINDTDLADSPCIAVVAAGTSDRALVAEIEQCLNFLGVRCVCYVDVGVAGLWRLTDLAPELHEYPLCVAVAGMEGALFSVLAGLVDVPVIAVPSSVGYGVSAGGHVALNCALASCAPGIAVVNIDNGFGAAALACKMLKVSSTR